MTAPPLRKVLLPGKRKTRKNFRYYLRCELGALEFWRKLADAIAREDGSAVAMIQERVTLAELRVAQAERALQGDLEAQQAIVRIHGVGGLRHRSNPLTKDTQS